MPRKPRPTLSDYVAELKATPPKLVTGKPGHFALSGELMSMSGEPLKRTRAQVTPAEAQSLIENGALAAFEGCGCGGTAGCSISWFDGAALGDLIAAGRPAFVKGFGSPTWIDVWTGDTETLVFAHGDVRWSSLMAPR